MQIRDSLLAFFVVLTPARRIQMIQTIGRHCRVILALRPLTRTCEAALSRFNDCDNARNNIEYKESEGSVRDKASAQSPRPF